jgi:hypothetical protein
MNYPDMRTWARNNGFTVGERGRLPKEVVEAYSNAFPDASNSKVKVSEENEVTSSPAPVAPVTPEVVRPEGTTMDATFPGRREV